jgi:hypothetical protein
MFSWNLISWPLILNYINFTNKKKLKLKGTQWEFKVIKDDMKLGTLGKKFYDCLMHFNLF